MDNLPSELDAKIEPATVTAHLAERVSKRFSVSAELYASNSSKWNTPTLDTNSVTISGTEEQIDTIRSVKAIIDASNQTGDFETNATLVAYDSKGETVDVQIEPSTVKAEVSLKNE